MSHVLISPELSRQVREQSVKQSGPTGGLLEACRAGDSAAWKRLFNEYADQIYRWTVHLGLPASEAADATQEVLSTCARRIDRCPSEEALTAWLYQIARRTVANARRKRWLTTLFRTDDQLERALEHQEPQDSVLELSVRRCLSQLSWGHRQVLVLAEIEGHTRKEIAAMLGIPEGTVASRVRLARDAFRRAWEKAETHSASVCFSWGKR